MLKKIVLSVLILLCGMNISMATDNHDKNHGMIVRISEIEIYPQYFDDYLKFAEKIAETSAEKEKGVISIYPMMQIRDKNQIRILEIYQDKEAYQKHIASEHFQTYKQGTLHMVKSLDLIDMYQLSPVTFDMIFKKSNN